MLLSQTLRSSTLRLALIYVGLFATAILALFGYVYWSTVSYLREKSEHAVSAERGRLEKAYGREGPNGLIALIERRTSDRHFDDWVYLVVDDSFTYVAGNLNTWPMSMSGSQGSSYLAATAGRALLRASYEVLPGGYHLLVAREADDLGGFAEAITTSLAWTVGLIILLAAAAGVSTARRSVGRIEAINATA